MASSGLVMQMTKAFGSVGLDALADGLHDLQVDADQVVAAHARLAGNTRRDDAYVGARDVGVVVGALEGDVGADDGGGLGDIERLALGRALGDVEQDDVAQRFARGHVCQGAADHAGADKGDLRASHRFHLREEGVRCDIAVGRRSRPVRFRLQP
jgi:hypothetical protein